MTVHDREILGLLRDDAELLAIADAVASTQRRRARRPKYLLAVPAIAVALIAVALFAPWQGSSPTFFDRALAAVGDRPVLHVITEQSEAAQWKFVDLESGKRTSPRLSFRTEIWYDPERSREHSVTSVSGKVTGDLLQTPDGVRSSEGTVYTCAWIQAHPVEATRARVSCRFDGENGTTPRHVPEPPPIVDPGLAGFLTGYRQALDDGTARQVSEGTVDGRGVIWLEMHLAVPRPPGADRTPDPIEQRVAVDKESYRPLLVEPLRGGPSYRVVEIETVSRDEADFTEPVRVPPEDLVSSGSVVSSTEIGIDEARALLGRPALWAGPSVHGLALTRIEHDVLQIGYARSSGLEPRRLAGLSLEYGTGNESVTIEEAAEPAFAYGWISREPLWPMPPEGKARIGPFGVYVVKDGVYVKIRSLLGVGATLAAARALEPIP